MPEGSQAPADRLWVAARVHDPGVEPKRLIRVWEKKLE